MQISIGWCTVDCDP